MRTLFEALTENRSALADLLDKPALQGVKKSVVEKYSDQAHFIYELLQNANDAGATSARFILEEERLIFAHDGTRHFSVSDPETEEKDSKCGTLGDINAITSIGNSNKTKSSIGKFGVGFKAVFQYSSNPCIYDRVFHFRIERFLVPRLLECDFEGRLPNETLFVFPFDEPEKAYSEILCKLKKLIYPVLFLNKLQKITVSYRENQNESIAEYSKSVLEKKEYANTIAQKLQLIQPSGKEELWLFTRENTHNDYKLAYSVGFFLNEKGALRPVHLPAFCFFPTREDTGLNFIIHAPFLLTDSREGILAGAEHNETMVELLSQLAGDSMLYMRDLGASSTPRLIDDNVLSIIPMDKSKFSPEGDTQKLSFLPFYTKIFNKFTTERLLPSENGYVEKANAYWADYPTLPRLFSDAQLAMICGNPNAHWVFRMLGREQLRDNVQKDFVTSLVHTFVNGDVIIKGRNADRYYDSSTREYKCIEKIDGITKDFVERQSIDWLHQFYAWLNESGTKTKLAKNKPVFLDSRNKAVDAYDKYGHLILFLPQPGMDDYNTVHPDLLKNSTTYEFLRKIGITEPNKKDFIHSVFLPKALKNKPIKRSDFDILFSYWLDSNTESRRALINVIKDSCLFEMESMGDEHNAGKVAKELYMPIPLLQKYFDDGASSRFLSAKYFSNIKTEQEAELKLLFRELGVRECVSLSTVTIDKGEVYRRNLPVPHTTQGREWKESLLEGGADIIKHIVRNRSKEKSFVLWQVLLDLIKKEGSLKKCLQGECHYHYYGPRKEFFPSSDAEMLRSECWLVDKNGEFKSPEDITRTELSEEYELYSSAALSLLSFLNISENDTDNLTPAQREKIEFADKIRQLGITEADIEAYKEYRRQKDARHKTIHIPEDNTLQITRNQVEEHLPLPDNGVKSTKSRVVEEIVKRSEAIGRPEQEHQQNNVLLPVDRDEYMPAPIDFSIKIDKAKQKSADEIEKIARLEELHNRARSAGRYTYDWFRALLDIESFDSDDFSLSNREISISFAKVEREEGTKKTLVLKHPNRYIPHFMEELADIPIILHFGDQTKKVVMEVANVVSYTLRVKLKRDSDIDGIDFSTLTEATIDAKSPAFLLQELRNAFVALDLKPEDNMQQNLPRNIEFIFGPPGTGKTTYLATKELIPRMSAGTQCHVLVLTPTNKAADVLTSRIMESCPPGNYEKWLVRFGATADEKIEQSAVYRDKSFDIGSLSRSVTITTIARFPYDSFMPQGKRLQLRELEWDYIVIDEASMISLAYIVYPLYKQQPEKFIIAGDPFQIEPITTAALWKNENIYTMVGLNSFAEPQTIPHKYKVELLTKQYRSVPEIGKLYSQFAYDGILKHHRPSGSRKIAGLEMLNPLNIIKFPVSRYESIYRSKRLKQSSSYHIYSALFTFEYVCHLVKKIHDNEICKIGIIAPYRAQADLIDKLFSSKSLPKQIEVYVGTIHGFQGDECDIIFAVFNTPPSITASPEMFLNKRNIINVSISRARDYLFVVMPDDSTDGVDNLILVKAVERIIKKSNVWKQFSSAELEQEMFSNPRWLEDNSFSTSHQSVNVYGLPEVRYEIRSEDSAVDIQIRPQIRKKQIRERSPKTESVVKLSSKELKHDCSEQLDITVDELNAIKEVRKLSRIYGDKVRVDLLLSRLLVDSTRGQNLVKQLINQDYCSVVRQSRRGDYEIICLTQKGESTAQRGNSAV